MGKKRRRKPNVRATAARSRSASTTRRHEPEPPVDDQDAEIVRLLAEQQVNISTTAYKMFLAEGGGELDILIENGQCSARAYRSQIRADEEGGKGWGPNITPYEDRMNRSLQLRLIREKQKWIEQCRQRFIENIKETYARIYAEESEPAEPEPDELTTTEPETTPDDRDPSAPEIVQPATTELQTTSTGGSP